MKIKKLRQISAAYLFSLLCVTCLLYACHPSYSCSCYLNSRIDTITDYGRISIGDAHKNCDALHALLPADSCTVGGIVIK